MKLKNTIMASFHGNIGWKGQRKREKYHYDFIPSQNMLEKAEKERK